MKTIAFIFLLLTGACSGLITSKSPKEGQKIFSYADGSGRFVYSREYKFLKNRVVTRNALTSDAGSATRPLEKSVIVSQLGTFKDGKVRHVTLRPYGSEFTVWLEGKKYSSKMRLDSKSRSMLVELDSPEEKWSGRRSIKFPNAKQFCFYSQIPECLYHNLYLSKALNKKGATFPFYVIWDGFPYIQDQLTGVGSSLFSPATVMYDGEYQKNLRYEVELDGQTVLYHFSKSFDLVKILWIAQGISIVPPEESMLEADD